METNQITADYYPIGDNRFIKLIPNEKLQKLSKGTTIYSVGGNELIVGEDELDTETCCFGRSKYGELIPVIDVESKPLPVIKGKFQLASTITQNPPYLKEKETNHGKPEKSETKHKKSSGTGVVSKKKSRGKQ